MYRYISLSFLLNNLEIIDKFTIVASRVALFFFVLDLITIILVRTKFYFHNIFKYYNIFTLNRN